MCLEKGFDTLTVLTVILSAPQQQGETDEESSYSNGIVDGLNVSDESLCCLEALLIYHIFPYPIVYI